ncbi:pilus assembly protein [Roseibaca sp. Y0-43]|nr:pilus assembly protein [Roseibaca sp. Y0-43]
MPDAAVAKRSFLRSQGGAVTVEFVILLPILLAVLSLIVSASLLFAAASDVQQLSHELARAGIWYYAGYAGPVGDPCAAMQAHSLPTIISTLPNLSETQIRQVLCAADDDVLRVQVAYDLSQNFGQILGRIIGLEVTEFVRQSAVKL